MKGKIPAKRGLALALAGTLLASTVVGAGFPSAQAAEFTYVNNGTLTAKSTAAPTPDTVVPNANQYWYQKAELSAFCHFGPNTFNEIEWGENYGNKKPDEIFKLEKDFDAETLVKTLSEAGFKMLIVTAKHHDGFCIWDSQWTDYDVAATSYKGGKGDVLAELSAACTEYNMDMGLYLSPWDIHEPSYGYYDAQGNPLDPTDKEQVKKDAADYNDYYNNQLEEILSNPKYGNNGHFREVWMDGAKGGNNDPHSPEAQEYDFKRWFATIQQYEGEAAGNPADCMLFGAEAYTTVRWIGNELGYAADDTWSKSKTDKTANTIDSNTVNNSSGKYTVGFEDGNQWTVPECDARITSGWFWGTTKNTPKTISALAEMYFRSVGHNSTFLLNVPPNDQGTVDKAILDRVTEFGQNVKETFRNNLAKTVQATNVRGNDTAFSPATTIDGKDDTYWTTEDGTNSGTLLIDLGGTKTFDVVSIEEAIQNGQHINEYKVEYKDANGEWQVLQTGKTIGAKRLVRVGAVKGSQVRITVTAPENMVPMISEVGVYKASEGFELAGAAPDGMDVIDVKNDAFQFKGTWHDEAGTQFVGGTNKWANSGASFTVNFTGTKIYLVGTKDPNHGKAEVYIDGKLVETIDTSASARALGQIIFESDTLEDKAHTLELKVTSKAIGIESAYTIDNGGKGMVGIEQSRYTMNEEQTMEVKLVRVGGTEPVTVTLSPNAGSAVQEDFDTEMIEKVTFEKGQTEATARVSTKRNEKVTGDLYFTVELTCDDKDVILGFNDVATVTIKDKDSESSKQLKALVDEADDLVAQWYSAGWDVYAKAVAAGKALLDEGSADQEALAAAITAITEAKNGLTKRTRFSEDDPVRFPWAPNSEYTVEAEFGELKNVELTSDGKWALEVAEAEWASNGKFVNCFNQQDTVSFPYVADRTGTYTVTATYRSGSTANKLAWSETNGKITEGSVSAGAKQDNESGITRTVTFDLKVTQAGAGTLVFTGPDTKSPQLDKLVITPKAIDYQERNVTVTAGEGGTVTTNANDGKITEGQDLVITITPNANYHLETLTVNGKAVTVTGNTYTVKGVVEDIAIVATFAPDVSKEELQALVDEADGKLGEWYSKGWDAYAQAIAQAKTLLQQEDPAIDAMLKAKNDIEAAKAKLEERKQYTTEDPFTFPAEAGVTTTLEAEFAQLKNTGEGEAWPLQVAEADWASHGKFINCLNQNDTISFPYVADRAGTYTVTATYRSGSTANKLVWSETSGKIASGEKAAAAESNEESQASITRTVTFELEVKEAGAGTLVFTGPNGNSPQLDKLEISLKETAPAKYAVTVKTEGEGTASASVETAAAGTEVTLTAAPAQGWHFVKWQSDDVTVADNAFTMPEKAVTVTAVFEQDEHVHSYGEPTFTFAEDGKTATAEFVCSSCGDKQVVNATITSQVKTEATCTDKGVTTYTATVEFGDKTYTATKDVADIPATGHHFENGVCTVCGEKDPNYVPPTDKPEPSDKPEVTDKPQVTDQPQTTDKPQATQQPTVPPTGDTAQLGLVFSALALSAAGLGAVVTVRKRRG